MGLLEDGSIRWRVHLASPVERVYALLAEPEGRARFWAESAAPVEPSERSEPSEPPEPPEPSEPSGAGTDRPPETLRFRFADGTEIESRVLERRPPSRFSLTYFGGSTVVFELEDDGAGGTDLTMTETGVAEEERLENLAGWVSVLLNLKAAADFGVDLRNPDPGRSWGAGYVDV